MWFFCLPSSTCTAETVKDSVIAPSLVLQAVEPEPELVCVPPDILNFSVSDNKKKFKKFCKENGLCVGCTYSHPKEPMFLSADGLSCPYCDANCDPSPPSPPIKKPTIQLKLRV